MHVLRDVLMQSVHVLPALGLAPQLQPGRHVKEARAARGRMRHHDLALVDGVGQVAPAVRLRNVALGCLDGVEADGRTPDIHADPGGRVRWVPILRIHAAQPGRRVRVQHPFGAEDGQTGGRQAENCVGFRVGLFSQQPRSDDAGRVAHPGDFDVRVGLLEAFLVSLQLIGFERGVNAELGLLCVSADGENRKCSGRKHLAGRGGNEVHRFLLVLRTTGQTRYQA